MKKIAATAFAGLVCLAALPAAQAAEQITSYTVLSPDDVKTYGAIFAAQKTGQIARADSLVGSSLTHPSSAMCFRSVISDLITAPNSPS